MAFISAASTVSRDEKMTGYQIGNPSDAHYTENNFRIGSG
jgi:hypothetical protein